MKLNLSILAGALALAVAGQANAALVDTNAANGSDLILSVWNATTGASFVEDLGISSAALIDQTTLNNVVSPLPSTVAPGAQLNANTAGTAALASILAGGTSGFQWNVTAGNTATQTWLSTATAGTTAATVGKQVDTQTIAGLGNYQTYLANVNLVATGAQTYASTTGSASTAYAGQNNFGANWSGQATFNTTAAVGTKSDFWYITTNGSGALGQTSTVQQFVNNGAATPLQLVLNTNGVVSVAAVPEPSEWLLMLSGFGLVGFIASRRKSRSSMSIA